MVYRQKVTTTVTWILWKRSRNVSQSSQRVGTMCEAGPMGQAWRGIPITVPFKNRTSSEAVSFALGRNADQVEEGFDRSPSCRWHPWHTRLSVLHRLTWNRTEKPFEHTILVRFRQRLAAISDLIRNRVNDFTRERLDGNLPKGHMFWSVMPLSFRSRLNIHKIQRCLTRVGWISSSWSQIWLTD